MAEHRKVLGGHELALRIADYMEYAVPGTNRIEIVQSASDALHGRGEQTIGDLMGELRERGGSYYAWEIGRLDNEVSAFLAQRERLFRPYTKTSNKQYKYRTFDLEPQKPLKIVNQRLYNFAVEAGFPPQFFEGTYFDGVTLYCMPDGVRCNDSIFNNCHFTVCRLANVEFWDARLQGCDFQSCYMEDICFPDSILADTRFYDCDMRAVGFIRTTLRHCNINDCTVKRLRLDKSILNGSSFGRMHLTPDSVIKGLDSATITCGGATTEEVKQLRRSIFKALGVNQSVPQKQRKRPAGPER